MIVCDHCEARTRQPLPHGWRVLWLSDVRAYGHACPRCGQRLDAGVALAPWRAPCPTESPVHPHGSDAPASAVDGRSRQDAGALGPPSQGDVEVDEETYDRPPLPRSLQPAPRAAEGASVADFVRKVGETFVPPAATRPHAAAPLVKPSEPPPPAQRSLFGGES